MKERFSAGGQDSPSSFTVSDIASRSSFSTSRWTASLEPLIAMLANLGDVEEGSVKAACTSESGGDL